jgi:hypothetical protein
MKLNRTLTAVALSLTLSIPVLAIAKDLHMTAQLLTSSEVPPKAGNGRGALAAIYDTSSKVLK